MAVVATDIFGITPLAVQIAFISRVNCDQYWSRDCFSALNKLPAVYMGQELVAVKRIPSFVVGPFSHSVSPQV